MCVQISLDRLAIMSRERGLDWQKESGWIEDLATGVIQTLAKVGLINLDLMDLRSMYLKMEVLQCLLHKAIQIILKIFSLKQ